MGFTKKYPDFSKAKYVFSITQKCFYTKNWGFSLSHIPKKNREQNAKFLGSFVLPHFCKHKKNSEKANTKSFLMQTHIYVQFAVLRENKSEFQKTPHTSILTITGGTRTGKSRLVASSCDVADAYNGNLQTTIQLTICDCTIFKISKFCIRYNSSIQGI